jgi:hypothetical protein
LSWHRWPWAGLALLGLSALTRELHAEAQPTPAKAWSFRLGVGLGSPVQSQQELLLDAEGYSGGRSHLSARAAYSLDEHVGVGVLGLYSWRNIAPPGSDKRTLVNGVAREYSERLLLGAAQLPLTLRTGERLELAFSFVPWLGVGTSKAEFGGNVPWQAGPAFGGFLEAFVPVACIGLDLGAYWVPMAKAGEAGGHQDLGMIYLSFTLGLDV